ncbi:hypothetical protein A11A3_16525 [Alcanivorax hongdengensis A-11-3]|uniref:DUF3570 domain-containing protein n=1 Tax=Alcanivorax hongdengensis A-11-3 TaxID=1177179 RepID=L0W9W3_9GAMM|nr:DUF3570 domain-containing protein [Alcanivorax hongdengensis]EKF72872.1 hypothetical protein A11A3_16525 [Alcanivorax hongdengensis A-11-3]
MKKTQTKQISAGLAAATCALLGNSAQAAPAADDGWKFDSAVLYYSEQDRVTAVEPVIQGQRTFKDDSELKLKLTVDSLTGASHNGAITSDKPQTFTSPSGNETYTTNPGEVPLDDSFHDTRTAANVQYTRPINRLWRWTAGLNFSNEYDFTSLGLNAGVMRDFNDKNSTLTFALSHEADTIDPVGGVPVGLSIQSDQQKTDGSEDRSVDDVLVGLTQVINRRWIMQLNYNLSVTDGYNTDPYKVVTVVDANGDPLEAEALGGTNIGPGDGQVFELRPDSRTKHALYWENRYHFSRDVLAVGYRFMTDDWGINSHTLDVKYRIPFGQTWYVQPHVRWYQQSEADFYRESITQAELATTKEVSADYRLGKLTDMTYGVKLAKQWQSGQELSFRVESFQQSGDSDAADLDAVIAQVGYTFYW